MKSSTGAEAGCESDVETEIGLRARISFNNPSLFVLATRSRARQGSRTKYVDNVEFNLI